MKVAMGPFDIKIFWMGFKCGLIGYAIQNLPLFLQVDIYVLPFVCLQIFKHKTGDRTFVEFAKKHWT